MIKEALSWLPTLLIAGALLSIAITLSIWHDDYRMVALFSMDAIKACRGAI